MNKVFIVEDEKMVASVIIEFLEKNGFETEIAYDLAEGMEKYKPEYDVVLLDIALKGETCFPLLERIKKEHPETVVLIFSGRDSEENIMEAKRLGADGFIPKPFRVEFLMEFLMPKLEAIRKRKKWAKD
ncbi:MAG: response regulator [Candidatus Omnitrophota bacterium]